MRWPSFRRQARPAGQVFDHACLAAFLVAVAIITALIVTAAVLSAEGRDDPPTASGPADSAAVLDRCSTMGPAAGDDAACRAAWAEARRAFFSPVEVSP